MGQLIEESGDVPVYSRPIDRIGVNQLTIMGEFEMGSLRHDVNTGTVTITFVNVHTLTTIYKDA